MRGACIGILITYAAAAYAAAGQEAQPASLAAARAALGGAALDTIRTVRMRGRGERVVGPIGMSSAIDIQLALPDQYVRVDRIALAGTASQMVTGFNGRALIQRASGPGGLRIDPAAMLPIEARAAAIDAATTALRQEVALLLLGLSAGSYDFYPLRFTAAGTAESPDRRADLVDVRGEGVFLARLFIDRQSRLPLMVSWQAPDLAGAALRTAASGSPLPASPDALTSEIGASVEHRLYFMEHRQTGSVFWPHRLRRSVAGTTVEEIAVDAFEINPRLAPGTFDTQP